MTFITKSYQNLFGVRSYINANYYLAQTTLLLLCERRFERKQVF